MPRLRVLRPHAKRTGIGVYQVGDVYDENELAARQKVGLGFAEYVNAEPVKDKRDPAMYDRVVATDDSPAIVSRKGNWYTFDDGEKVLGKKAAAERAQLDVEELENVPTDDD